MKHVRKGFIALTAMVIGTAPVWAQSVAPTFQEAMDDIGSIAASAGALVGGIIGLIGLGRTAYKLANGDGDAMTSLVMAVVGIFIGFIANSFL
ncbi:MAG: hypothetical protein LBJ21_02430 [Acidobacteriota bacterium]|jgi:hypothetical protein|nr:hypothetical protein [Acidobacteriota bacterium]